MARCNRCGKKGFFLKVDTDGICTECNNLIQYENQKAELENILQNLNAILADKSAEYNRLAEEAKTEGLRQAEQELSATRAAIEQAEAYKNLLLEENSKAQEELDKKTKSVFSATNKLLKTRELAKSVQYTASKHSDLDTISFTEEDARLLEETEQYLAPTVALQFKCMNVRQLRKEFNKNQRLINETLTKYKDRYTTKANASIYKLMVIALEAELQNILYSIGYGKLDKSISQVKAMTEKYRQIATAGNQNIAPTLNKFIGEIEYFFIRAVEIEYEYYVQKERAREEQRALREQMRQEAHERKELERQRKHIEKEESKYLSEIDSVQQLMNQETDDIKLKQLHERIAQLQDQLNAVNETKEEILKLQTGKAGNVYIISNLGSFGDNVFKIGMTRRLDPMDRVKELSSASVPFPFDVHSFVFSDDAVGLEASLHKRLHTSRVNKVNLRKEFFSVSIDELENLVYELEPTAEFNRTLLAEQYNQSLSIEVPDDYNPFSMEGNDDEDETDTLDDED